MYSMNTPADANKENVHSNMSQPRFNTNTKFGTPQTAVGFAANSSVLTESFSQNGDAQVAFAVEYIDFDALPTVTDADAEMLVAQTQEHFNSGKWLCAFDAVTALRSLNRSFPMHVNALFAAFDAHIAAAVQSARPSLSKNALAFVFEVLNQAATSSLDVCVAEKLVELLLRKATSTSNNMKELACKCIAVLVQNCLCDGTLVALCRLSTANSALLNDKVAPVPLLALNSLAFYYLGVAVSQLGNNVAQLAPFTLQAVFVALSHNLLSRCSNAKQSARNMCRYFNELMEHNYEAYVMMLHSQHVLADQHARALADAIAPEKQRTSLSNRQSLLRVPTGNTPRNS